MIEFHGAGARRGYIRFLPVLFALMSVACVRPAAYNPGDPGSEDFYVLRAMSCALGQDPCVPVVAADPCKQLSAGSGTLQGCTLNLSGIVTTLAGSGINDTQDGIGTAAHIGGPNGMATNGLTLFLAQAHSSRIRAVDIQTGLTISLAGSTGGFADGIGSAAQFNVPRGVTTDGTYIYVADAFTHRIRRVEITTGSVTTLAGSGVNTHTDAVGTAAAFKFPESVAIVGTDLYVGDSNNKVLRKIDGVSTSVSTPAGMVGVAGMADATGNAASFNTLPAMVSPDGTNLYICDYGNHSIRKVDLSTLVVTTFAGQSGTSGHADGNLTSARFFQPNGITTDGDSLYISDAGNDTIRKIDLSTNMVTTIAGLAGTNGGGPGYVDGAGSTARFDQPSGLAHDGTYLYVSDSLNNRIRRIE